MEDADKEPGRDETPVLFNFCQQGIQDSHCGYQGGGNPNPVEEAPEAGMGVFAYAVVLSQSVSCLDG